MLSSKQLSDVCMADSGDHRTCRYLRVDELDSSKFYCYKLRSQEKQKLDTKLKDFIRDCKKKNIDPTTTGVPMSDNCPGYPVLRVIQQGYDVDK